MYKTSEKLKEYKRNYMRKWRLEHPQAYRNQLKKDAKKYREKNPEKVKEMVKNSIKNWRLRNPEKNKAHRLVASAIRNGTLVKEPCFCDNPDTQAHHSDYSKPLDVEWLCKIHHTLADKQLRRYN